MNNLSIRKMRILLATAEEGNFTRAAQRENISQPAATIIINEIDATIGHDLFVRQGSVRKALLTDIGRTVAETFSRIVAGYDLELARINATSGGKRKIIRVLIQSIFSQAIDPKWLFSLIDLGNDDQLLIEEATRDYIIDKINTRDVTLALVDGPVDAQQCDSSNIATIRFGLAVPDGMHFDTGAETWVNWSSIPSACYVLSGISNEVFRSISNNLIEAGKNISDFHIINGVASLCAASSVRPLPILMPDVLAHRLQFAVPHRFYELGPALVNTSFSLVTPWGHMNQINVNSVRDNSCFREKATLSA